MRKYQNALDYKNANLIVEAVKEGNNTYSSINKYIESKVGFSSYGFTKNICKYLENDGIITLPKKEKKVKEVLEVKEPVIETIWLKDLLQEKGLTRATPKLERELEEQGYIKNKTTSFPAKVFYTRTITL